MKKLFFSTTIALLLATMLAAAALAQGFGQDDMLITPYEAPPGYQLNVAFNVYVTAGTDGATDMCVFIPNSNFEPIIVPPDSFTMTYGSGSVATFVNNGSCFTFSDETAVSYRATGLPSTRVKYTGSIIAPIQDQIQEGSYTWSARFSEMSASENPEAPTYISSSHMVLEPTAITLASTGIADATSLPYFLGMAMLVLSLGGLHVLKRRYVAIDA